MKEQLIQLFNNHPQFALLISVFISVIVALLGLVPSVFITAANILFFGFWQGTLISFLGEALGAIAAFVLYRKEFKKTTQNSIQKFPKVQQLINAEGKEASLLIISLRLIPFVPSGLVTFAAAIGKVSLLRFIIASSIGKAPALLIEAYSVYQVTQFNWQGKLILLLAAIAILVWVIKNKRR